MIQSLKKAMIPSLVLLPADAVQGTINIITKTVKKTQGITASTKFGDKLKISLGGNNPLQNVDAQFGKANTLTTYQVESEFYTKISWKL